ncbi:MAG: cytochrome P450 [Actinomycetota bacterium]
MMATDPAAMLEALSSRDYLADPGPAWAQLREDHPLLHDPVQDLWIVSRYADVAELLSNHETYSISTYAGSTGAVLGETLIQMDGPDHVWRRSAVAPEFVGKRLEGYAGVVDVEIDRLIAGFPGGGTVDIVRDFSRFLPVNVIVAMLGFGGSADKQVFRDWVTRIMAGLAPLPEPRADGIAARDAFASHIAPYLAEPIDRQRADLIARVARAEHDGQRLHPDEVVAFLGLLFIAGGETTDKAIGNLWWNLLRRPELLDACRAESALLEPCFSETMRVDAPVIGEDRFLNHDVELHGNVVPAGARIRGLLGAANRDPEVFADPESFDHERSDLHLGIERRTGAVPGGTMHLGFGLGKHFCLGYQLARREAVRGSERLLDELRGVRFADPDQQGPRISRSMRSLASLPVVHDG